MRTRVLRSEVEEHKIGIGAMPFEPPFFGVELQCFLLPILFFIPKPEGSHFGRTGRVLFS
ncbi:hypothetical protein D3C87_1893870 [compost metagenome]